MQRLQISHINHSNKEADTMEFMGRYTVLYFFTFAVLCVLYFTDDIDKSTWLSLSIFGCLVWPALWCVMGWLILNDVILPLAIQFDKFIEREIL